MPTPSSAPDFQRLYHQLGRLIEAIPDEVTQGVSPSMPDTHQWLARAYAAVEAAAGPVEAAAFKLMFQNFGSTYSKPDALIQIVYRAMAICEASLPAGSEGAFIPVGNSFDAFNALSRIFASSRRDVFLVDPYLDESVLTEFAQAVPPQCTLRLLGESSKVRPTLRPAASAWVSQYGVQRPLEVRLAAPRLLHDRAIFVDGSGAWTITQSLKDFAKRSPAEIVKATDTAPLKVDAV